MSPRATFTPENKAEVSGDFPRLKLENGEKARVVCIEDPVYAHTHTLRAPKIVNGKAEQHTVERKDGSKFQTNKLDFIGRPQCLGDLGILQEKGVDPKNCPVCELSIQGDMVDAPQRRFAMHIVRYATRQGTFELANPFSVSVVVWSFTDTIFNKLTDFVTEWGPLLQHDLLLGPCTNKDFQKFDIAIANKAAWLEDDARKEHVKLSFKENQTKDLESFCGRKVERSWLMEDLEKIRSRWRIANGEAVPTDAVSHSERESLSAGLTDLMNMDSDSSSANTAPTLSGMEDLLGTSSDTESTTKPVKEDTSSVTFDDLLQGL